jgi:hypothetical protein
MTRFITVCCSIIVAAVLISDTHCLAQQKNVLRIWFDTVVVKSVPSQFVVMNCWFSYDFPKPHSFRGFDMRFIYEAHQIQPSNYFFDKTTACGMADYHIGNSNPSTGNAYVVVLSGRELDLTKQLLFSMSFTAKAMLNDRERNDTVGLMEVVRFDLPDESGIDTVIITNGWIKYVQAPPTPLKRKSIRISSEALTLQSDSSGWIPVYTTALDSAVIKNAVLTFTVDTTVIRIDTVAAGSMLSPSTTVTLENKRLRMNVYLSDSDTSQILRGSGELLKIKASAVSRIDTVCTALFDSAFLALNTDNMLDTVAYSFGSICVEGKPPSDTDTTTKSVRSGMNTEPIISISPNPASAAVSFVSSDYHPFTVEVISVTGALLLRQNGQNEVLCDLRALTSGLYRIRIQTADGRTETRSLLVIR